eukprot:TRINITY_DN30547_c0_g1_i1.p1 TRINITY_DN30547_c0_g1~~TRINITY_DN30547_c0_g1_i1.p1  ORF type:complete len:1153 (+),score=292.33 TRINITY_DN30547_c0_g1_i1:393-3461(+)
MSSTAPAAPADILSPGLAVARFLSANRRDKEERAERAEQPEPYSPGFSRRARRHSTSGTCMANTKLSASASSPKLRPVSGRSTQCDEHDYSSCDLSPLATYNRKGGAVGRGSVCRRGSWVSGTPFSTSQVDVSPGKRHSADLSKKDMGSFWRQQISTGAASASSFVEKMRNVVRSASSADLSGDCKLGASLRRGSPQVTLQRAADGSFRPGGNSLSTAATLSGTPTPRSEPSCSSKDSMALPEQTSGGAVASNATVPKKEESVQRSVLRTLLGERNSFATRDAFRRFRALDTGEVSVSQFSDVLLLLGRFGSSDEAAIAKLAAQVQEYQTFNPSQFDEFLEKFSAWEREWLIEKFESDAEDGQLAVEALREFLAGLDVYCTDKEMHSVLREIGLADQESLDIGQLFQFVVAYRAREGFSDEDIKKAYEVFAEAQDEDLSKPDQPVINAGDNNLMGVVLNFFGLWAFEYAESVFKVLPNDDAKSCATSHRDPVRFGEFLAWARRVRDSFMSDLAEQYEHGSNLNDGLEMEDLKEVMHLMGYTLLPEYIESFLDACEVELPLDFDGFVTFAKACFESDGFTEQEIAEFRVVYDRFDYNKTEEIDALGVIDMIAYLGHHTGADRAQQLIRKVDFNGNDSMDPGEFLRLMRLHREEELATVRDIFKEHAISEGRGQPKGLTSEALLQALGSFGEAPPSAETLERLTEACDSPDFVDFDAFIAISDRWRKVSVKEKRKRAGFSDAETEVLRELFDKHCADAADSDGKADKLDMGGLIWLLKEVRVPTDTRETRNRVFELLKTSRATAADAGVEGHEIGEGDNRTTFTDVLHLLRMVIRENERIALIREEEAVQETKFSTAEVEDFRKIFRDWHKSGRLSLSADAVSRVGSKRVSSVGLPAPKSGMQLQIRGRRGSALALGENDKADASAPAAAEGEAGHAKAAKPDLETIISSRSLRMGLDGVALLLASIGVKVSDHDRKRLFEKANTRQGDEQGLDFADFLRVMRWMLDDNFAGINTCASEAAKKT